jgi:hypothetical protein
MRIITECAQHLSAFWARDEEYLIGLLPRCAREILLASSLPTLLKLMKNLRGLQLTVPTKLGVSGEKAIRSVLSKEEREQLSRIHVLGNRIYIPATLGKVSNLFCVYLQEQGLSTSRTARMLGISARRVAYKRKLGREMLAHRSLNTLGVCRAGNRPGVSEPGGPPSRGGGGR